MQRGLLLQSIVPVVPALIVVIAMGQIFMPRISAARLTGALSAAPPSVTRPVIPSVALSSRTATGRAADAPLPPAATPPGWRRVTYAGAPLPTGAGRAPARLPSYSVAYPRAWGARLWPDTLAGYGQLQLWSPAGGAIDVLILPLRASGPTLGDLIAHDTAFLMHAVRDGVVIPLGSAVRLSGSATPGGSGRMGQILYVRRGSLVYRFFATYPAGSREGAALLEVAATLQAPAPPPGPSGAPPPPAPPLAGTCCRCPAAGTGWGAALTSLDGIPVYSNAGAVDNGCTGTYGILYQCVELAQRYFALRWGYPAIWGGVYGAADMRAHHPSDIAFIPNGGTPGPREGDALVFYGGGVGHVALVKTVDPAAGQLTVVEENWSPTGEATLPLYGETTVGIRDSAYGSYTVAGWLHSPRNQP